MSANSLAWWGKEIGSPRERADTLFRWLNRVNQRQKVRQQMHLFNACMYEDFPAMGLGPYQYATPDMSSERLRMNLCRAVVNAYVARISRSKPKPQCLTSDGDWVLRKRAEGMTRWWEGKQEDAQIYRNVSQPCVRDTGIFGMGCAKVYREWPDREDLWDVGVERIFPWEIACDDAEAQNVGNLLTLSHQKWIDRAKLKEMFPSHKDTIRSADRAQDEDYSLGFEISYDSAADLVQVTEAWRLPSTPDGNDGLHVWAIRGDILFAEKWKRSRFPIPKLYRAQPTFGIWATSICQELRGMQLNINQSLRDIEEAQRLYAKPRWMVQAGSVNKAHLDDDLESIVEFQGNVMPQVYSPQAMPPEVYQFLWQVWQKGFEQVGLSQASSHGNLPPGISGSGASIRAWNDVEDGAQYEPSSLYEDWHMEMASLMFDEARSIAEVKPEYASTFRGKTYVEIVKFKDVDPGADNYWLRTYPMSRLASHPGQRLAQIQELYNSKLINEEDALEMLDWPDVENLLGRKNATRKLAQKLITRFLEAKDPDAPGVFLIPEDEWPLGALHEEMMFAEVQARIDDAPEGNCRLMRNFMTLCEEKLTARAAKEAANAPPPGMPPPGDAGMPPGMPPPGMPPEMMNGAGPPMEGMPPV